MASQKAHAVFLIRSEGPQTAKQPQQQCAERPNQEGLMIDRHANNQGADDTNGQNQPSLPAGGHISASQSDTTSASILPLPAPRAYFRHRSSRQYKAHEA